MPDKPQSYANHARFLPAYHMVAGPILLVYFLWCAYQAVTAPGAGTVIALIIIFFAARIMTLTVQDRVIRLEMRLRLRELLPPDLQPRIGEFTHKQLVAMRFASDAELPALARKVLEERLTDGKAIKQLVRDWQADTLRA